MTPLSMDGPRSTVFIIIPHRTKMPIKGAKFRGVKSSHRGKKASFPSLSRRRSSDRHRRLAHRGRQLQIKVVFLSLPREVCACCSRRRRIWRPSNCRLGRRPTHEVGLTPGGGLVRVAPAGDVFWRLSDCRLGRHPVRGGITLICKQKKVLSKYSLLL